MWFGRQLDDSFPYLRQYGANIALIVLTLVNLISYADSYIASSVKQLIIDDLHISDFQSSLPSTGIIIVYSVFSLIFGVFADKSFFDRRIILCFAILSWSIATSAAGLANDLVALVLLRSLIGVGQAAYATISIPMLTDFFPVRERNVMFGIFYLSIPVGGAVGYGVGAVLGELYGWRIAFLAMGVPGLILSFLVLSLNNPMKGINDVNLLQAGIDASNDSSINSAVSSLRCQDLFATLKQNYTEIMEIMSNKYFVIATAGLSVSNFAISGLAEWYATFLYRYDDLSIAYSGILAGGN